MNPLLKELYKFNMYVDEALYEKESKKPSRLALLSFIFFVISGKGYTLAIHENFSMAINSAILIFSVFIGLIGFNEYHYRTKDDPKIFKYYLWGALGVIVMTSLSLARVMWVDTVDEYCCQAEFYGGMALSFGSFVWLATILLTGYRRWKLSSKLEKLE